MDAHFVRYAVLAAAVGSLGASYRTPNFAVTAATPEIAEQIGRAAEKFRSELAVEWLGKEMQNWSQPCPITVQVGEHLGAGGATSFVFEHGEVFGWRMTIQGSLERVLDSVLPHEVTHTVFATHLRQPLPRWADEGACTTVEHASERAKQQAMLVDFLRTGRGIAFSRMFAMKEYPHDVMPLYSQGYSVARYLVAHGGRQKFLVYVGDGLRDENWARATQQHYGIKSLADLQSQWLDWVRKGSPALDVTKPAPAMVVVNDPMPSERRERPAANLIHREGAAEAVAESDTMANARSAAPSVYELASAAKTSADAVATGRWRAPREAPETSLAAVTPPRSSEPEETSSGAVQPAEQHQMTRPQAMQRAGQVILEWNRPHPAADDASAGTVSAQPGPGAN